MGRIFFFSILTALVGCKPTQPKAAAVQSPDQIGGLALSADADISALSAPDKHTFLMEFGEKIYQTGDSGIACSTCHQRKGEGLRGAFPSLVQQDPWIGSCEHFSGIVVHGLRGKIVVGGDKFNGVMIAQGKMLNDLQIAAVTSYVRNNWGNSYGDCTLEDVRNARENPKPWGPAPAESLKGR